MKRLNIVMSIGLLVSAAPTSMYAAAADENPAKRAKIAIDEESMKQNSLSQEALNEGLLKAAQAGDTATVCKLLGQGADINAQDAQGITALMLAAAHGHAEVVRLLLANKANINTQNAQGCTALIFASQNGHTEVAAILIESKADVNARTTQDFTALILAAKCGHAEVARLLLANDAHVNAQNTQGGTPLMWAAWNGCPEIASPLLAHKADISLQNHRGSTALVFAVQSQQASAETVQGLLGRGGGCGNFWRNTADLRGLCPAGSEKQLAFDKHTVYLCGLMSRYNKAVEAGTIQGAKIVDLDFAQRNIVKIQQALFKAELGFLFAEENLIANIEKECLFNLYFNPFEQELFE
jgi:hypothetical protein